MAKESPLSPTLETRWVIQSWYAQGAKYDHVLCDNAPQLQDNGNNHFQRLVLVLWKWWEDIRNALVICHEWVQRGLSREELRQANQFSFSYPATLYSFFSRGSGVVFLPPERVEAACAYWQKKTVRGQPKKRFMCQVGRLLSLGQLKNVLTMQDC